MRLDRERSSFEGRGGCSPAGFEWALGWLRRGDLLGALDSRLFGFDGG